MKNQRDILEKIGSNKSVSDWVLCDQAMVDAFALATKDWQYIHVDPVKAKESPFGGTIAHGFLTLSLLSYFAASAKLPFTQAQVSVNYGFNKIRLITPVYVGSRIRASFILSDIQAKTPNQELHIYNTTIEIEGAAKPAVVAEWLAMLIANPEIN